MSSTEEGIAETIKNNWKSGELFLKNAEMMAAATTMRRVLRPA
jgi:hypothetical protein